MDCLADETTPPDSTWMAADEGDERQHKNTQSAADSGWRLLDQESVVIVSSV
jgi:hypothetical protein